MIEAFPVGRRLAFDAAKGRLWVICPSCERWNLSPIEERWEAVESCEKLFRGQKLRAQTDNVGLARLAEGTELIRIGSPLRPEFAAWRYGGVFRRRRERRNAIIGGTGVVAVAAAMGVSGFSLPMTVLAARRRSEAKRRAGNFEELAAIADNLLTPRNVTDRIESERKKA